MTKKRIDHETIAHIQTAAILVAGVDKQELEVWELRLQVGQELEKAFQACQYGDWMTYVEEHFPKSYDTADRYRKVAKWWPRGLRKLIAEDPSISLVAAIKHFEGNDAKAKEVKAKRVPTDREVLIQNLVVEFRDKVDPLSNEQLTYVDNCFEDIWAKAASAIPDYVYVELATAVKRVRPYWVREEEKTKERTRQELLPLVRRVLKCGHPRTENEVEFFRNLLDPINGLGVVSPCHRRLLTHWRGRKQKAVPNTVARQDAQDGSI